MNDIYKDIEEYNPYEKPKILILFDDMIADMLSNKEINPIVTALFIIIILFFQKMIDSVLHTILL